MLSLFICFPGRGAGNSKQWVTEITSRGIWLWVCCVRQEKVEISALNQTCDKSTGGVQGEGGLVHWLPVPPVPELPPYQATVTGITLLPGGWVLLGQGQVSWWLVSAFQGCTVPWRARQGTSRAITVPRSWFGWWFGCHLGLPLDMTHPCSCTPAPCTHPVPQLNGRAEVPPGISWLGRVTCLRPITQAVR